MDNASKNLAKALVLIAFGLVLGAACIYFGEIDDAPGLMLIGVVLIIGALIIGYRTALQKPGDND